MRFDVALNTLVCMSSRANDLTVRIAVTFSSTDSFIASYSGNARRKYLAAIDMSTPSTTPSTTTAPR